MPVKTSIKCQYHFDIVWTWGCHSVMVFHGGEDFREDEEFSLESIFFESMDDVEWCLYEETLYLLGERTRYGEPEPDWIPATAAYNEKLDLYEFVGEEGRAVAMARLIQGTVVMWSE